MQVQLNQNCNKNQREILIDTIIDCQHTYVNTYQSPQVAHLRNAKSYHIYVCVCVYLCVSKDKSLSAYISNRQYSHMFHVQRSLTFASKLSKKSIQNIANIAPKPARQIPIVPRRHCLLNRSLKCILKPVRYLKKINKLLRDLF